MSAPRSIRVFGLVTLAVMPLPLVIVAAVSVSPDAYLDFPPSGFSLRWYAEFLTSPVWMKAFGISALIAVVSAVLTSGIALLAALAMHGWRPRARNLIELLILAPLIFPHAALGVAFMSVLIALRSNGTLLGLVLVHLVICLPFAYRPIAVSLRKTDVSLVECAMILGATPFQALWRVVLPVLRPGLVTALLFSFIFSFDEVTISMFLVSPESKTLPVSIYAHIHDAADPIVAAISTVLILITLAVVLVLERSVGLQVFVDEGDMRRETKAAS